MLAEQLRQQLHPKQVPKSGVSSPSPATSPHQSSSLPSKRLRQVRKPRNESHGKPVTSSLQSFRPVTRREAKAALQQLHQRRRDECNDSVVHSCDSAQQVSQRDATLIPGNQSGDDSSDGWELEIVIEQRDASPVGYRPRVVVRASPDLLRAASRSPLPPQSHTVARLPALPSPRLPSPPNLYY